MPHYGLDRPIKHDKEYRGQYRAEPLDYVTKNPRNRLAFEEAVVRKGRGGHHCHRT